MSDYFRNSAGYVGAKNELDLHRQIINGKVKIRGLKFVKHHPRFQQENAIPDFLFLDEKTRRKVYVEVKPWFLSVSDIQQIVKYWIVIHERHEEADLGVLCGGVSEEREELLRRLGIRIYLLKDVVFPLVWFFLLL